MSGSIQYFTYRILFIHVVPYCTTNIFLTEFILYRYPLMYYLTIQTSEDKIKVHAYYKVKKRALYVTNI